jgi:peptidoglycan/LPS O-acetylase OafA/YrhL
MLLLGPRARAPNGIRDDECECGRQGRRETPVVRLPLRDNVSSHVGGLDLIRFFAASLVLMFHLAFFSWASSSGINFDVDAAPKYPDLSFLSVGWVGVEIFFVLSGFVISQSADGNSAFRFLRSRVGRLLPAVWICSTLTVVVSLWLGLADIQTTILSYLRTLVIYPKGPWIDGVYWTLTLEVFFYGMIFILLTFNLFKHIEIFAMVLGGFSSVYVVGLAFLGGPPLSMHLLAQHGCFFALGIFFWLCSSREITAVRILFSVILIIACLIEICFIAHGHLEGLSFWLAPSVWLLSMAAILFSIAIRRQGNAITRKLGLMTYPLYLLHFLIGSVVLRVNIWTGRYFALALATIVAMGISWVVVELEFPLRVWIEGLLEWLVQKLIPANLANYFVRRTIQCGFRRTRSSLPG